MTKKLIFLFLFVGSVIGSYIPLIWGASMLSGSSIFFGLVGGFFGIYVGYRIGSQME